MVRLKYSLDSVIAENEEPSTDSFAKLSEITQSLEVDLERKKAQLSLVSDEGKRKSVIAAVMKTVPEIRALKTKKEALISRWHGLQSKVQTFMASLRDILHDISRLKRLKAYETVAEKGNIHEELQLALSKINWPTGHTLAVAESDSVVAFKSAFYRSVLLELTTKDLSSSTESPISLHTPLQAVRLLCVALLEKFSFHFEGVQPTNRQDKPEWVYTYVLTILNEHKDFFNDTLQPLVDRAFEETAHDDPIRVMDSVAFCLLQAVQRKMQKELPAVVKNLPLFSQWITEAIAFEQAMRTVYRYPDNESVILDLFTKDPQYTDAWLMVDDERAHQQFAEIMNDEDAWTPLQPQTLSEKQQADSALSAVYTPAACEAVLGVIHAASDRYSWIGDNDVRLLFFHKIQAPILAEFLEQVELRGSEATHSGITRSVIYELCALINCCHVCANTLTSWGDEMIYMEMYDQLMSEKDAVDTTTGGSLFDGFLQQFISCRDSLMLRLIKEIGNILVRQIPEAYTRALLALSTTSSNEVSLAFCDGLVLFRDVLYSACEKIHEDIRADVWSQIASKLNNYLFSNIVYSLDTHVRIKGAQQLTTDMNAVVDIFRKFTSSPESFFRQVKEGCLVLTQPESGLRELYALHDGDTPDEIAVLAKHGIDKLSVAEIHRLCKQRVDVKLEQEDDSFI